MQAEGDYKGDYTVYKTEKNGNKKGRIRRGKNIIWKELAGGFIKK